MYALYVKKLNITLRALRLCESNNCTSKPAQFLCLFPA